MMKYIFIKYIDILRDAQRICRHMMARLMMKQARMLVVEMYTSKPCRRNDTYFGDYSNYIPHLTIVDKMNPIQARIILNHIFMKIGVRSGPTEKEVALRLHEIELTIIRRNLRQTMSFQYADDKLVRIYMRACYHNRRWMYIRGYRVT